ncbi:hypothetical protein IWQ56_004057 [Coemansia nantahalensis]|nr:hypothetical protein IWQ56_004057 [Coemansia nantahalensis]
MAFIMYVQSQIKGLHVAVGAPTRGVGTRSTPAQPKDACLTAARLLLPSAENQFTPDGFGEDERIDFALLNCPVGGKPKLQSAAHTRGFFAIVNCEVNQDDREHSLKQLVASTRHVYQVQHNRVFAWALSVCGTLVYAVVMLHDAVLVSPAMDVSTPAGRKQVVELLVDWAACDDVQAGYDPTIVDGPVRGSYRIECPNENGATRWYTATHNLVAAEDVLGSHTRYFAAKPDDADGASDVVLIKDAFVRSSPQPDGSACEETRLLRRVENTFGGEADFQHPRLVRSGNVKLPTGGSYVSGVAHNGVYDFGNNTDTILSVMGAAREEVPAPGNDGNPAERSWMQQPHRVCRRLVMTPCGEPLSTVSSEAELIVVLADVMRCHTAIRDRLRILHRDISPNNIMVARGADGLPHGLLVGYDSAIPADDGGRSARPERSGALPYTSIWNLEGGNKRQTALDDCEAMLYILCMLGTLGVTSDQRTNDTRDLEDMPISQWSANTPKKIAEVKREHMDSAKNFRRRILRHFHPECMALRQLAEVLHAALFLHDGCAGAEVEEPVPARRSAADLARNPLAAQQSIEERDAAPREDPLDQRLMHENAIVEALTRVMAKCDEPAKQVLREGQANAQAVASPAGMQEATTTMETLCMWDGSSTPIWVLPTPSPSSSPKRKSRGRSRGKKPMLLDKVV